MSEEKESHIEKAIQMIEKRKNELHSSWINLEYLIATEKEQENKTRWRYEILRLKSELTFLEELLVELTKR